MGMLALARGTVALSFTVVRICGDRVLVSGGNRELRFIKAKGTIAAPRLQLAEAAHCRLSYCPV